MFTSLVLTKGFPPLSSTRFWGMSISGVLAHSKQVQFFLLLLFRTATLAVTLDAVLPVQVFGVLSKAFLSYEKLEKQEQICHKQEVTTTPNYLPSMHYAKVVKTGFKVVNFDKLILHQFSTKISQIFNDGVKTSKFLKR